MHCISIHFAGRFLYAVFKVDAYTMHILCLRRFLYVVGKGESKNCEVGVAQTRSTGYSIFLQNILNFSQSQARFCVALKVSCWLVWKVLIQAEQFHGKNQVL